MSKIKQIRAGGPLRAERRDTARTNRPCVESDYRFLKAGFGTRVDSPATARTLRRTRRLDTTVGPVSKGACRTTVDRRRGRSHGSAIHRHVIANQLPGDHPSAIKARAALAAKFGSLS